MVCLINLGQTGSGKTHTIFGQDDNPGILFSACLDIIQIYNDTLSNPSIILKVRFYEIYGTKVYDLLNQRQRVELLEDGRGNTQIVGLKEININTFDEFKLLVEFGCRERTVGSTEANPTSSRSHAVLQIMLVDQEISQTTPSLSNSYRAKSVLLDNIKGQFTFVDLAGSERGVETGNISRQARQEGSEINKSLLALKECIRALYRESSLTNISNNSFDEFTSSFSSSFDSHIHIPFRGSILTRILRDSFTEKTSRTVMFATIGPGSSSVEHSLNTLRYADRVKELKSRNGDKSEKKSDDEEFQNDDAIVDEIVTSDRDSENSSEIQFKGDEEIVDDGNDGLVDLHAKTVERMKVILQDEQKLIEDFVNGDIELNEYTLLVEGLMMQRIDETMIVYNSLKR